MKRLYFCLAVLLSLALAMPAFAGIGSEIKHEYDQNGKHYNLLIIGVPHDKTNPMQYEYASKRNTIFVPLNTEGAVPRNVKIYYQPGDYFGILDANATDDNRAVIQVPYEYCEDYSTGCIDMLSYDVFAVGLGKPNGIAIVEAECSFTDDDYGDCTSMLLQNSFTIRRTNNGKNKPKVENITDVFRATGCLDLDESGICDAGDISFSDLWIFNIEQLAEYYWDYDNYGLKLMQMRFYPTTSGAIWEVQ